jgi:hypothetical protein
VNIWAEDLEKCSAKLVTKKGYVGLEVSFDETGQNRMTLWGQTQNDLAIVLKMFAEMAENGVVFE